MLLDKKNYMAAPLDDQLMSKIKEGDTAAYEKFFRREYARLVGFACRFLKNLEVAEDIVQDAFLKFWLNRASLDLSKSGQNLLYVMVRNASLDYIRSRYSSAESIGQNSTGMESKDLAPDEALDAKELKSRIARGIAALPPQRQLVYRMSNVMHITAKEIAEQLNISERTVQKHIELAKKDLKKDLKKDFS